MLTSPVIHLSDFLFSINCALDISDNWKQTMDHFLNDYKIFLLVFNGCRWSCPAVFHLEKKRVSDTYVQAKYDTSPCMCVLLWMRSQEKDPGGLIMNKWPRSYRYLLEEEIKRVWSSDTVTKPPGLRLGQDLWCCWSRSPRHSFTHAQMYTHSDKHTHSMMTKYHCRQHSPHTPLTTCDWHSARGFVPSGSAHFIL